MPRRRSFKRHRNSDAILVKLEANETPKPEDPQSNGGSDSSQPAPSTSTEEDVPVFNFLSPRRLFESLIYPVQFEDFINNFWEKKPLHIERSNLTKFAQEYEKLFNVEIFHTILNEYPLDLTLDVNLTRYVNGQRDDFRTGVNLTYKKFDRSFHSPNPYTVQFHQPQRFCDPIWQLLELLESFFGCLVGSNVYMTQKNSQGLAPHHDDVEVFILQLEGEKHWYLYKPLIELAREYSRDLSEDEIGEPTHNIVLKPGDILYFPRGTVHQARAIGDTHSTHLTVSTYQKHTYGDFLCHTLPILIEETMEKEVCFRQGLPINFLRSTVLPKSNAFSNALDLLVHNVNFKSHIQPISMIQDFMLHRLPPYGINGPDVREQPPAGVIPRLGVFVRLLHPDHICFTIKKDPSQASSDSADHQENGTTSERGNGTMEDGSGASDVVKRGSVKGVRIPEMVFMFSSVYNDRRSHMMKTNEEQESNVIKFPKHFLEALTFLQSNAHKAVPSVELPLPSDEDKEKLLTSLWASHVLEVVKPDTSGGSRPRKYMRSI